MGDAADTRSLGERLAAVAARLPFFGKDGYNDHHKYNYVSEARVKQAVRDALAAEGLLITAVRVDVLPGSTPTAAVVKVTLYVGDGCGLAARFEGVGGDQDKSGKAVMKATAAAIKYALTTAFLVPTGDDPEANKEADEIGRGAAPKRGGGRRAAARIADEEGAEARGENPHAPTDEDW